MLRLIGFWAFGALVWGACAFTLFQFVPDTSKIADLLVMGLVPAGWIIYIGLALVGTMLPAAAALQDASFDRALATGRAFFWRTFANLLLGNGLYIVVSVGGLIAISQRYSLPETGAVFYAYDFVASLSGMFGMLLTATALCIAYESGQPDKAGEQLA